MKLFKTQLMPFGFPFCFPSLPNLRGHSESFFALLALIGDVANPAFTAEDRSFRIICSEYG